MVTHQLTPAVMRTPRTVEIELTTRCNLHCRGCSRTSPEGAVAADLPTAQWEAFIEELGCLGVMDVTLAGGEPLMRPDIRRLIEAMLRSHLCFQLHTNGTLVTEDLAKFLSASQRCSAVQVCVDGASAAVHDRLRGKGAFEGAVRAIRILQRYQIPVTARVTIHHHNLLDLENIARFLLEELGLSSFGTYAAGYQGSCRNTSDDFRLTTEERQLAMHTLLHLENLYPERIQAASGPLADGKMWQIMEKALTKNIPAFPLGGRLTGCVCIFRKLSVRADGSYIPCAQLPHLVLGHIGVDSLLDIWQNHPTLLALRQRREIPLSDFAGCRDCTYRPYCTGSCPALAYAHTGLVDHPNPETCLRSYLASGGSL